MTARSAIAVVDLEGGALLGRAPGSFEYEMRRHSPGVVREVQVAEVLAQLGEALRQRQVVLLAVDCAGGYFTAAVDVLAQLRVHRAAGLPVVVDVSRDALSAAAIFMLGASYIVIAHHGRVGVHSGSVAPAGTPASAMEPGLVKVLAEKKGARPSPAAIERVVFEQETLASAEEISAWLTPGSPDSEPGPPRAQVGVTRELMGDGSLVTLLDAQAAVRLGFADEVGSSFRALEVAHALARGEPVRSLRRERLRELGRGDRAPPAEAPPLGAGT